ncbi:sulfur carrier protein ThiS [Glutamicibacter sp. NPDC087344]|uniref:sulfur carrier protein ThiS n=1 Tax=Glutamicibacter sp. NPDC087344 TaxID=3363994 RepID=UPI003828FA9D
MSIQITLNSAPLSIAPGLTVRELVTSHTGRELTEQGQAADGGTLGIAVAVDGAVVPRSAWSQRELAAGNTIELVTAAQGG